MASPSYERETLTSPLDKRQTPMPARRRQIHPEVRLAKSWMPISTEKKRLRQDFPAAQSLSNPGWPFSPKKKRLRQDFPAAQGLSNPGWPFSPKKSACGKTSQQHRACQVSDKVRSGLKTSNLARTGSRINGLGRKSVQMDRTGCPDPSGPLPGLRTAS